MNEENISAKIDENGYLYVRDSHNDLSAKYCPFNQQERCGDWCPLFSYHFDRVIGGTIDFCFIELCNSKVIKVVKEEFYIEQGES